jgi:hypothetical protein
MVEINKGEKIMEEIMKVVQDEMDKEFAEEGISKEVLDMIDLDIAYSPVIPVRKGTQVCEVKKTYGGKYLIIDCPFFPNAVDKETIRVMRARFLLSTNKNATLSLSGWVKGDKKRTFF